MPRNSDSNKQLQATSAAASSQQPQQCQVDQLLAPNGGHQTTSDGASRQTGPGDQSFGGNYALGANLQRAAALSGPAKARCYLCETPKHEYSLIRAFSEIVCRSCLNYEGPERVEQLILLARRDKFPREMGDLIVGSNGTTNCCAGENSRAPMTRTTRHPRNSGRRLLPAPAGGAGNPARMQQTVALLAAAMGQPQWPLPPTGQQPALPDLAPASGAEEPKRRREPASAANPQYKRPSSSSSPAPKLSWKSNGSVDQSTLLGNAANSYTKAGPILDHAQRAIERASSSQPVGGHHVGAGSQQHQQPPPQQRTPNATSQPGGSAPQPAYSQHQTVGSPVLASAVTLHEAMSHRQANGASLSPTLSNSPGGQGPTGNGKLQQAQSSVALSSGSAPPPHLQHLNLNLNLSNHHQQQLHQPPPLQPVPLPPTLQSHISPYPPPPVVPVTLPVMMRNLASCDQYARESAAYEFFMGQQRSHLAAHEAHSHYTSQQHLLSAAQQAHDGSKTSPADMYTTRRSALFPPRAQPPPQLVAAGGKCQAAAGGPPYPLLGPYVPLGHQLADLHYGCIGPAPDQLHPYHHHHHPMGASRLASGPTYVNLMAAVQQPGGVSSAPGNLNPTEQQPQPKLKGTSSSSSSSAATLLAPDENLYDFRPMEPSILAQRLLHTDFQQQMQQIQAARRLRSQQALAEAEQTAAAAQALNRSHSNSSSNSPQPIPVGQQQPPAPTFTASTNSSSSSCSNPDQLPNTEATLRILLNPDPAPGPPSARQQLVGSGLRKRRTSPFEGSNESEPPSVGSGKKSGTLDASGGDNPAAKYAAHSAILTHNHNPNKAFRLGPAPAKRTLPPYNLEEISPPSRLPHHKPLPQKEPAKRNQLQSSKQPILVEEDELDGDGASPSQLTGPNAAASAAPAYQAHAGQSRANHGPQQATEKDSDPTEHESAANCNYSLRSQAGATSNSGGQLGGPNPMLAQVAPNSSPSLCNNPAPTGGLSASKTNRFGGHSQAEQQSGLGARPKPGQRGGQPTSAGSGTQQNSSDQLKCLLCNERLEDRHFVQCPTVLLHKFCFACSKVSIQHQKNENMESKSNEDKVFCPSGKKCLLASERSPWTFMNNEIETIFREKSRNTPMDTMRQADAYSQDYFDKGNKNPPRGSVSSSSILNDATTSGNNANDTNQSGADKNISDNRLAKQQQLAHGAGSQGLGAGLGKRNAPPITDVAIK